MDDLAGSVDRQPSFLAVVLVTKRFVIEAEDVQKRRLEIVVADLVDGGAVSQVFVYPPALNFDRLSRELRIERERRAFIVRNARIAPTWSPPLGSRSAR